MASHDNQERQTPRICGKGSLIIVVDTKMVVRNGTPGSGHVFQLAAGKPLPLDTIQNGSDRLRLQSALKDAISSGVSSGEMDIRFRSAGHELVKVTVRVLPLYRDLSTIDGAILVVHELPIPRQAPRTIPIKALDRAINVPVAHQTLVDSIPEGVFTIDLKWRIISFNHEAETITGFSKKEAIGRHCWEIFQSDMCNLNCPLRQAMEQGRSYMDQDVRMIRKGGEALTILVNAGLLKTMTGKVIGAVETFRPLASADARIEKNKNNASFPDIIGQSAVMKRLFSMLTDIAASDANVLLTGESGTGKELVARTLHKHSQRGRKPFVAVNCSALAESLLESELFGHEKAAFTGAAKGKVGRFEMARGGTLFLDEIGDLKPELQVKLLRVLEQREFERVGGTRTLPMDARIISATHQDLRDAMAHGTFREDLYYRLRTVPLTIPPLRHRLDDIPLLVDFFVQKFNSSLRKQVRAVDDAVMGLFMQYHWPGNVRELERTLEHAFVFVKGPLIQPHHLPAPDEFSPVKGFGMPEERALASKPTREAIVNALTQTDGARADAARLLGISRTSLWRRMRVFKIS